MEKKTEVKVHWFFLFLLAMDSSKLDPYLFFRISCIIFLSLKSGEHKSTSLAGEFPSLFTEQATQPERRREAGSKCFWDEWFVRPAVFQPLAAPRHSCFGPRLSLSFRPPALQTWRRRGKKRRRRRGWRRRQRRVRRRKTKWRRSPQFRCHQRSLGHGTS